MPVTDTHPKYTAKTAIWKKQRDALGGEEAIKAAKTEYLPDFIPVDPARYAQYIKRASYVNVTSRTQKGLNGAIFRKGPEVELSSKVEYLRDDYDGSGQSLEQLGKVLCGELLAVGSHGLLVDYPAAEAGLSQAEVKALNLRAIISSYTAEDIDNWETVAQGGSLVLTMVKLKETKKVMIDAYSFKEEPRYRVLLMEEGKYVQRLFTDKDEQDGDDIEPKRADGSRWPYIPFQFVGVEDNRPSPDSPPLADIAAINIAHYRNSADHEESLYIHGQGTLFVSSDMSPEQWKELNPNGIIVGARRGHFLGAGGTATLLQVQHNSAIQQAMKDKEAQMKMIGARLITSATGTQTAEAARIDASSETSVLANIAGNASEAITNCLGFCEEFMGGEGSTYELNTAFFDETMTAQDVMACISLEDRGIWARTDTRAKLKRTGWLDADRVDEDIDAEAEVLEI